MKYLLLALMVFGSIACGKYDSDIESNSIGESRSANALTVTSSDRNNLTAVCSALAAKASTLGSVIGNSFLFTTKQSDCDGKAVIDADITVKLQNGGSGFVFKNTHDGMDYIFPEVETPTTGLLSSVCGDLSTFSNPIIDIAGQSALWITTSGIPSKDCVPASGEVCVQVEKGMLTGDQTYTIHTKEWMRVRVNSSQDKYGFFSHRKKVTNAICSPFKAQISEAFLK